MADLRHVLPYDEEVKILVCGKNEGETQEILEDLAKLGHGVVLVNEELEALRRVRTEWFDCLILDWDAMGLTPLKAVRGAPWSEDVLAILLQSNVDEPSIFEGYHFGADMVLTKPFNPHELVTFTFRR